MPSQTSSTAGIMERMDVESPTAEKRSIVEKLKGKLHQARKAVDRFDRVVSTSTFGRIFRLDGSGHVSLLVLRSNPDKVLTLEQPKQIADSSFLREVRAGATTFATMAYIIAVNVCSGDIRLRCVAHAG